MTQYWLLKSEPDSHSWDRQVEVGTEPWTGVRNHRAAGNLKDMKVGDKAFFYHSNIGLEIVGTVEVVREAYPDPTDGTGKWVCVDVRAGRAMPKPVSLKAIKADPALEGLEMIRQSRLSVVPVSAEHWRHIKTMGGLR